MTAIPSAVLQQMLEGPAGTPPPNVIPHLTTHSDDQKWYYLCASLCTGISGAFLLVHLYTRFFVFRKVLPADIFIILGFILSLPCIIIARHSLNFGAGVHIWNLKLKDLIELLFWFQTSEVIYGPCIFCIKTGILLQYVRLFSPTPQINRLVYYGTYTLIGMNFIFYTIKTGFTIWTCTPRAKVWNPTIQGGRCFDYHLIVICASFFNVFSDLATLLLPVRAVFRLQIELSRKITISVLFATGLLASVACIMRGVYEYKLVRKGYRMDHSYDGAWAGLWSEAEVALGLIVPCTLSLPKFYREHGAFLRSGFSKVTAPFSYMISGWSTRSGFSIKSGNERSNGLSATDIHCEKTYTIVQETKSEAASESQLVIQAVDEHRKMQV